MTKEERADAIIVTKRRINMPHPKEDGMRIVGWVVDEDVAGMSDALFALDVIQERATKR